MDRHHFIRLTALATTGLAFAPHFTNAGNKEFPNVRVVKSKRRFSSETIETIIRTFRSGVKDPELGWLFENCFPNTLDTTVFANLNGSQPDTYIITGDIDAMWLRDSTAQVWPYLQFMTKDQSLKKLIHGLINRQVRCILKDPYANAFYFDDNKQGEWKDDLTEMKPGIHERKWEIDSLCYPIRLAYHYWKITGDLSPFGESWKTSVESTLRVFREQQRKNGRGPYSFQRTTAWATDGVPLSGYGYPVKPVGLICSMFRPSDDATVFPFLIPSNFFAVVSLRQASVMVKEISKDNKLASDLTALAVEVDQALQKYAVIDHAEFGKIYAYEVNGYGSFNLMDDANIPSLLSLPYLDAVAPNDSTYLNTRKFLLSENNPFYFSGKAGEGIGGPHAGIDMIWPLSIIIRGLTSKDDAEIMNCITILKNSHGGTGFMHEAFHKDDDKNFTRKWFAWANTLFGELLWNVYQEKRHLLS